MHKNVLRVIYSQYSVVNMIIILFTIATSIKIEKRERVFPFAVGDEDPIIW